MFGLFSRAKNKVKNPKILIASIGVGSKSFFAQDRDIYQSQINNIFDDITEYEAVNIDKFWEFIEGKTFDIVHLFVNIEPDGKVESVSGREFFEKLSASEVKTVLFASDNPADNYIAFASKNGEGNIRSMNTVMTIERKGEAFPSFFQSLFGLMAWGRTMPMAWVELAPQNPHLKSGDNIPGAIFVAGLGSLKFVSK